jgi:hypothetical protein
VFKSSAYGSRAAADGREGLDMAKKKRCQKRAYKARGEAEAAKAEMIRRWPRSLYKRTYRCARCKAWHITSTPPGGGRKRVQH